MAAAVASRDRTNTGLAKVIDDTMLDDGIRLGLARRVADVLESSQKDFDRNKFIDAATKTKRTFTRTY